MKRKLKGNGIVASVPRNMKPRMEERDNLAKNFKSISFSSMPPELVVLVASYLDVTSYLALASSSTTLFRVLVSEVTWKRILQRINLEEEVVEAVEEEALASSSTALLSVLVSEVTWGRILQRINLNMDNLKSCERFEEYGEKESKLQKIVKGLALLLQYLEDPGSKLRLALLHKICESFPPPPPLWGIEDETWSYKEAVSLSCPCNEIHEVSACGFALLEQAELHMARGANAEPLQKLVSCKYNKVRHLEEFASRAVRQEIEKLDIYSVLDPGKYWGRKRETLELVKNSKSWSIKQCWVDSVALLEVLAKGADRGWIFELVITDDLIRMSKVEDLKRLWSITFQWEVRDQAVRAYWHYHFEIMVIIITFQLVL